MKIAGIPSQSALARASGVPQPTINRILKEVGTRGPEAQTLQKLAMACNVSFDWLHEGIGPMLRLSNTKRIAPAIDDDPNFYQIPKVKLKLSAGVTGFATVTDDYENDHISIPKRWIDSRNYYPASLIAITVKGESMEPSLYEGDLVIVNTEDRAKVDGAVYAFNFEGEAVVKRLVRDLGQWWLSSDNPDQNKYRRKSCRNEECIIVGRVVKKESERI